MDREKLQTFVMAAEDDLASVRSSLLIVAQSGKGSDLAVPRVILERLACKAREKGIAAIEDLCIECQKTLSQFGTTEIVTPAAAHAALDTIARIEAMVWAVPIRSADFLSDVGEFVDVSFRDLMTEVADPSIADGTTDFEIDEETLEIFREEAEGLLTNIAENLGILSASPSDQTALWEVRRNAHTFKGAAGIVGLSEASAVAHRIEDLLDQLVELRAPAGPPVIDFLVASTKDLHAILASKSETSPGDLESSYAKAVDWLRSELQPVGLDTPDRPVAAPLAKSDPVRTTTTPIVRVSLDRLDELIKISRSLIVNRSAIRERLNERVLFKDQDPEFIARIETLLEAQQTLTDEIQARLLKIRMVRFGTLEARLSRNVNVTCTEEAKKAVLEIENGDVEIDTQVIDALIEPLLHLLKNAVVHGIEHPDTRRLIGKPERGTVTVRVEADDEALILSVADDGSGISPARLREKALLNGIITAHQADSMNDRDSMQLIFDRGLTTSESVNLNAGRGVGMSIVKEAVESRGGSIVIKSEPQRGTTFTILMPLGPHGTATEIVKEPEMELPEPSAAPLILIVDDSPSVRRHSTKLIEQAGMRAITANNGAEALELLLNGEWEPDMILSDVEMPQIDGWAFLEYVKTDEHFGHIPVVMVTSLDTDEFKNKAADLGASDYFIKPLSRDGLARIIDAFISKPV